MDQVKLRRATIAKKLWNGLMNEREIAASYQRDGYVIPSEFRLTDDELADLREAVDTVLADNSDIPSDRLINPQLNRGRPCGVKGHPAVVRVARDPRILDLAEAVMGPNLVLLFTHMFCKPANSARDVPWHQDGPFWRVAPLESVSGCVALDDVDAENDRFEAYTIMVMPGDYEVDNRPGVVGVANLPTTANFESELYKFNPKSGGVVVPRGTSVVGYDLRKTVIRPKYVPNPGSKLGSDTGDNLGISHAAYDAAKMIEKARGYIVDQSYLYIDQTSTFRSEIDPTDQAAGGTKCRRDLGYFVDGLINDLREGGNANTFNIGQRYTDGTGIIQSLLTSSTTNISVTNAVYVPATGALTLTVASGHGLSTGDYIKIPTDGLKFKCAMDGSTSVKTYPRSSDPAVNQPLKVTVSSNDITVNVGATLDNPLDIRTANVGSGTHVPVSYTHLTLPTNREE